MVVLGQTDFRKKRGFKNRSKDLVQVHKVGKIFLHPLFVPPPKSMNDIALLEIKGRDIEVTNYVQQSHQMKVASLLHEKFMSQIESL